MKIYNYLKEDRILLNVQASHKEAVIRELAGLLQHAEEISDLDTFVFDIFSREKLATTGIGEGIAIPHARSDAVKDFVIVFGRSLQGIPFDAIDMAPVKLIFLMGTPKGRKMSSYIKLLAHLSTLLKDEDFRYSLLSAANPADIIALFKKLET